MVQYKCRICKKKFKVTRWFNYIVGGLFTLGFGFFIAYFYCEKCWKEKENKREFYEENGYHEDEEDIYYSDELNKKNIGDINKRLTILEKKVGLTL